MKGGKLMPQPTRPLGISEHARVRTSVSPQDECCKKAEYILALARQSWKGLSKEKLAVIELPKLSSESSFHCLR